MASPHRPSLEDVARLSGVSTATISRCINNPSKVAKETRERIEGAIETLGYLPHFGGRALARNRTNTIGAIIPSMDNAMFAGGLQAFQNELMAAGVTLLVGSSNYDADQEFRQIRSILSQGADGLLLIGEERPQKTKDFLAQHSVPHVLAWCFRDGMTSPSVGFDNCKAAAQMARHVMDHGHQKLAVVAGIRAGNDRATARVTGIKSAVANCPSAQLVAIEEAKYSFESAGEAFDRIMDKQMKPTAIICGSDVLAVGVLLAAQAKGLRVPHDISITGFDDINLARVTTPALTTAQIPQQQMGKKAAQVLLDLLADAPDPAIVRNVELVTQIVDRASLARLGE